MQLLFRSLRAASLFVLLRIFVQLVYLLIEPVVDFSQRYLRLAFLLQRIMLR